MNHQTNVHLHDGDTVLATGSILEAGDTPALSIDIVGTRGGDNTQIVLYLSHEDRNEAFGALDAIIDAARDLKVRIAEAAVPSGVSPITHGAYTRPVLVSVHDDGTATV